MRWSRLTGVMSERETIAPSQENALRTLQALLRRLRVEQGLSMAGLALRARLGRTTVSQALNRDDVLPSESTLVLLAKALRTSPVPLLRLRSLAEEETGEPPAPNTRFTYDYLAQRPTSLLRVLHDKLKDSYTVGLRIRTVDIYQSWDADDDELPERCARYAAECLAGVKQIDGPEEKAEALLLLLTLRAVNEHRSALDPRHEKVRDEIDGSIMVFLDWFAIESLTFLEIESRLEHEAGGGCPHWSALEGIRYEMGDE